MCRSHESYLKEACAFFTCLKYPYEERSKLSSQNVDKIERKKLQFYKANLKNDSWQDKTSQNFETGQFVGTTLL